MTNTHASKIHTRTQKSEYKSWKQQQDENYYSDGGRIECYVYNHEVTIEFVADNNKWTIQAWTEDGYMVEERYCDTLEECRGYVDDMIDALEDEQAQSDSWYED